MSSRSSRVPENRAGKKHYEQTVPGVGVIFHKSMMITGIMGLNLVLYVGDHIYGQNPLLGPNQFNSFGANSPFPEG